MPESSAAIRPSSPDAGGGSERKRRRKVLSCYDCRRRKLQCDRVMPACGRCTKAGQAANCLYIDDPTSDTPTRPNDSANPELGRATNNSQMRQTQSQGPSGDLLSRLEYQGRRIKQLESALNESIQSPLQHLKVSKFPLTPESVVAIEPTTSAVNATDRETMLLRGKSFKTQFHGITYPGSLIAYIPELASFTKEVFENFPALRRIRQEMHALEDRTEYAGSNPQYTKDSDLSAALPSKLETDGLVQLYFDNYHTIYHFIHMPTFRQEYNGMWNDLANARPHFVAIVLLLTATSHLLVGSEPWLYTANSSTARERAIATIALCEGWLQRQSQKHVTVADFQIRFLIVLAKMLNGSKFKRTWTDAGNLLRFFMSAGLHRNPDHLRKPTSALDKEMRRRLWFAAAEFEMQASFGRGMISAPWPQQSDCSPPSNIQDEDIDQTAENLPASRSLNEFTSTSYLIAANETFSLRYMLNSMLNNIRQTITFEDAKRYTDEIEAQIQALPHWIGTTSEAPQALLSITLRQYLLVLHDRQFRLASSHSERNFSKLILADTAAKIIDSHKQLVEKGNRALQFLCHDQLRAALSVCHIASLNDPQSDSMLSNLVEKRSAAVISDTIDLLTDKIARYGREQRQLWIVLAANAFMKTKRDPSQKMTNMQEAVDKITKPYYKILAGQEDAPSAVSTGPPSGREDLPNGILEYLPNGSSSAKVGEFGGMDSALLDLDDIAAWTFDDWAFVPGVEMGQFGDVY